jgi:hypothetical protein
VGAAGTVLKDMESGAQEEMAAGQVVARVLRERGMA